MAEYDGRIADLQVQITYAPGAVIDDGDNTIPCLVSKQSTQLFTTSSVAWVYSSQIPGLPYLAAADLATATSWLVHASASCGADPWAFGVRVPHIEVVSQRNVPIPFPHAGAEGMGLGVNLPEAARFNYLDAWFEFFPDGTDLEFRMEAPAGFPTHYAGMTIIAIPISQTVHPRKLVKGSDLFGSQGLGFGASPVLVTAPFDLVWEHTETLQAGNYLVLASMMGKTTAGNVMQARFLVDGIAQKTPQVRYSNENRDIMPFVYGSPHVLTAGPHTFRLEGGSAGGVANKQFFSSRIWILNLNNFLQWTTTKSDAAATLGFGQRYPNWATGPKLSNVIQPTSAIGEYILTVGNSYATRQDQGGIMSRVYNATLSTPVQEYSAFAQVRSTASNPQDIHVLSSVGCELANLQTTYEFQHILQDLPLLHNNDTTVTFREFTSVSLNKVAGPAPPTVFLTVTDTIGTPDTPQADGTDIGPINKTDIVSVGDSSSLVGTTPPVAVPNVHPRFVINKPGKLSQLRQLAGYDDNGNQIGPGSTHWQRLLSGLGGSEYSYWMYALRYKITQNPAHLTAALNVINNICDSNIDGYENDGLVSGRYMRQAALYYDWLYHDMSTAQRTKLQDYMMGLLYAILSNPSGIWTPQNDWARNEPQNNYFFNWHQATMWCGIALYHDVWPNNTTPTFAWPPGSGQNIRQFIMPARYGQQNGPTYTSGWDYAIARHENLALINWRKITSGGVVGGGWHEGSWYRPMWSFFDESKIYQDVAGYFPDVSPIDFADFVYFNLHQVMPGGIRLPENGDSGSADVRKEAKGADRVLMLLAADTFRGTAVGGYAQWWLQNVVTSTEMGGGDNQWDGYDFLYYDPTIAAIDYRDGAIAKYWHAKSMGLIMSRTGWGATDHCAIFHATDRLQVHMHGDNGGIQIYSGRGGGSGADSCFLVGPRCAHGSSGENQGNDWRSINHSTWKLAGVDQRASKTSFPELDPNDHTVTGNLDRVSLNSLYVYAEANMSDAYRYSSAAHGYAWDGYLREDSVESSLREWLHLPALGVVLTYDRNLLRLNAPDGTPITQAAECHIHYTKPQPSVVGDIATLNVGTARLFRKFLYPTGQTSQFFDENGEDTNFGGAPLSFTCVDEKITMAVNNRYCRLLTALETTDNTNPAMMAIDRIVASPSVEGATFDKGGVRYHVVFSSAQTGGENPTDPFTYDVLKQNNNDVHIVCNLRLGGTQRYFVSEALVSGSTYRYTVARAGNGILVDGGGTISFTPASLSGQLDFFIVQPDFIGATDTPNLLAEKFISQTDTVGAVDSSTLQTIGLAFINKTDTLGTAETTIMTPPLLGSDAVGLVDSVELEATGGTSVQKPFYKEKIIQLRKNIMYPAVDVGWSFFVPEPNDGNFFDKVNDETDEDDSIIATGSQAEFASITWKLSDPGQFVGKILRFRYVVRVKQCLLGGSLNARIQCAIGGLGIVKTLASSRDIILGGNQSPITLISSDVEMEIDRAEYANMQWNLAISGNPIGANFYCAISGAKIEVVSFRQKEKQVR